ncbi:PREDICTED: caspase-1-like [Rhagoletis zephyria]|uniref:caspase-1-like n=1 Tax=Rhagoletis zephyria TaxID=28612 RepID=UPI000811588D|nr:PREDICTED: caspase-1-like [Rhagoletis zephyria]
MNHLKRGRCIVLNYKHFSSQELRAREGTEKDGFSLKKTFENLNFDIETHENLTLNETFDVLQKESNRNHESYDCFVLCILTHGSNGILHCKDRQLKTEQIFNLFTANRCRSLVGKPKLFFIQACQGEMFDSGTLVHDSPVASPGYFLIPNYADFLIFYSTYPGHFSWRNSSKGSWFIQELCEVLEQYNEKYDLMTMLTIVCRKVAFEYQSNVPNNLEMDRKKQIPCILSTLTRLVQF